MEIKEYKTSDKQDCLSLYISNIGEYWRSDELEARVNVYLD